MLWALSPEAAARPYARALARGSLAKDDPAFRQVVGRHLDVHAVTYNRADAKFAHLAGSVGNDPMFVVEHYAETPIRHNLVDEAFQRHQLFFCDGLSSK